MKIQITIVDSTGKVEKHELDDDGKRFIIIGNSAANSSQHKNALLLDSPALDPMHAQLVLDRKVTASPFDRQNNSEQPVCHLIVLSEKGNVFRADHRIAIPSHQFIPWYRGDVYSFDSYTLYFERENIPSVPLKMSIAPSETTPRNLELGKTYTWEVRLSSLGDRRQSVKLQLEPPDQLKHLKPDFAIFPPNDLVVDPDHKENNPITTTLSLTLPKDWRNSVGHHEFVLRATSSDYQSYKAVEKIIPLNIQPFSEFTFAPQEPVAKEKSFAYFRNWWFFPAYWFTLKNEGNHIEKITVTVKDNFGKSNYYIEQFDPLPTTTQAEPANISALPQVSLIANNPQTIELQPGGDCEVRVMANLRGRRHVGLPWYPQRYVIDIAATVEKAQPQSHQFFLYQRPLIVSGFFMILLVVLSLLGLFLYTPRITSPDFEALRQTGIIPGQPFTLQWQAAPAIAPNPLHDLKISDSFGNPVTVTQNAQPITSRFGIVTNYSATVTLPDTSSSYALTFVAQNNGFTFPLIGSRQLLFRPGRVYGKDTLTETLTIFPRITLSEEHVTVKIGEKKPIELRLSYKPTQVITPTVQFQIDMEGTALEKDKDFVITGPTIIDSQTLAFLLGLPTTSLQISTVAKSAYVEPTIFTIRFFDPKDAQFAPGIKELIQTIRLEYPSGQPTISLQKDGKAIGERLEVAENSQALTLAATLSLTSTQPISFNLTLADESAKAGTDYRRPQEFYSIPPGTRSIPIAIPIIDNPQSDGNRNFIITLTNTQNALLNESLETPGHYRITILDNESEPTITIQDAQASEETKQINFPIAISPPSTATIDLNYSLVGIIAKADTSDKKSDFPPVSRDKFSIPANTSSYTLVVAINDDDEAELNETLDVLLASEQQEEAQEVVLLRDRATGTILDNDGVPTLVLTDTRGSEADGKLIFKIGLNKPSSQDVQVRYATVAGNATVGEDFEAIQGTLTIPAGAKERELVVTVIADNLVNEPDETIKLQLSNPEGAVLGEKTEAIGTIEGNTDDKPTISIDNMSIQEPQSADGTINFTVRLSQPSGQDVQFTYSTADNPTSARRATAGVDYIAVSNRSGTIPKGQTTIQVGITVKKDDKANEGDETFLIRLGNTPVNANPDRIEAVGTIQESGSKPTILISDAIASEGNSVNFTISLTKTSALPIMVSYTPRNNGSANGGPSCSEGIDFVFAPDVVSFTDDETTKTISVITCPDFITNEFTETFALDLSAPQNATLAVQSVNGQILDEDGKASLILGNVSQNALNSPIIFVAKLSHPSAQSITISYNTEDETAESPTNYTETSGNHTFQYPETEFKIQVPLKDDPTSKGEKTFRLKISVATDSQNYVTNDNLNAIGTIVDNTDALSAKLIIKKNVIPSDGSSPTVNSFAIQYDCENDNNGEIQLSYYSTPQPINISPLPTTCTITETTLTPESDDYYYVLDTISESEVVFDQNHMEETVTVKNLQIKKASLVLKQSSVSQENNWKVKIDNNESIFLSDTPHKLRDGQYLITLESPNGVNVNDYKITYNCGTPQDEIYSNNFGIGLNQSEAKTCTFTILPNPKIKLCKALEPDSDAGKFTLTVSQNGNEKKIEKAGNGNCTDKLIAEPGSVVVKEEAENGTSLDNYQISLDCIDESSNQSLSGFPKQKPSSESNVTVVINQQIKCTFTNTKIVSPAILAVDQSADVSLSAGVYTILFTVSVTNTSNSRAEDVLITNTITANVTPIQVSSGDGKCSDNGVCGATVLTNNGDSYTVKMKVMIKQSDIPGGTSVGVTNNVTVTTSSNSQPFTNLLTAPVPP